MVLGEALGQVVLYWTRFRALTQDRPAFKQGRGSGRTVELPALMAEIDRFSKTF